MTLAMLHPVVNPIRVVIYRSTDGYNSKSTSRSPEIIRMKLQKLASIPLLPMRRKRRCQSENENSSERAGSIVKLSSFQIEDGKIWVEAYGLPVHGVCCVVTDDTVVINRDGLDLDGVIRKGDDSSKDDCQSRFPYFHDAIVQCQLRSHISHMVRSGETKGYSNDPTYLVVRSENHVNTRNFVISSALEICNNVCVIEIISSRVMACHIDLETYLFSIWVILNMEALPNEVHPIFVLPDFHLFSLNKLGHRPSLIENILAGLTKISRHHLNSFCSPANRYGNVIGITNFPYRTLPSRNGIHGQLLSLPKISPNRSMEYFLLQLVRNELQFDGSERELLNLLASAHEMNVHRIKKIINALKFKQRNNIGYSLTLGAIKLEMKRFGMVLPAKVELSKASTANLIGGNAEAKAAIHDALLPDEQLFDRYGIMPPSRILLYGPPGTGR